MNQLINNEKYDFRQEQKTLTEDSPFEELAKNFVFRKSRQVKESSIAIYLNNLRMHIIPAFGKIKIKEIDTYLIEDFLETKKELSENFRSSLKGLIISILDYGKTLKIVTNEIEKIKVEYTVSKKQIEVFTPEEVKRLKRIKDQRHRIIMNLFLETGMRIGELSGLKFEDIDMSNRRIEINKAVQRISTQQISKVVISKPKSKSGIRVIPMTLDLFLTLEEFFEDNKIDKNEVDDFFIITYLGILKDNKSTLRKLQATEPTEPRSLRYTYERALKILNIGYKNPHTTRHTFATHLVKKTSDFKTVSKILGHKNIEVTMNTYVHSNDTDSKEVIGQLD